MTKIADILSRTLDVKERFAAAWHWWIEELRQCLPVSVQAYVMKQDEIVCIDVLGDEYVIRRRKGDADDEIERGRISNEGSSVANPLRDSARSVGSGARVVMRVSSSVCLVRRLRLPLSGLRNLKQILRLELDRQIPVDPAEIYFDYRVVRRDRNADRMDVELRMTKRATIDGLSKFFRTAGYRPATLEFMSNDGLVIGAPFVLDAVASKQERMWRGLTPFLLALSILLAIVVANASLSRKQQSIDELANTVASLKVNADQVSKLRSGVVEARSRIDFLNDQRQKSPMTRVLNEVARVLPDNAWIFGFEYDGRQIRLRGYSPKASSLIALFDASPIFENTQFRSALVQDAARDVERFDMSFELKMDSQ